MFVTDMFVAGTVVASAFTVTDMQQLLNMDEQRWLNMVAANAEEKVCDREAEEGQSGQEHNKGTAEAVSKIQLHNNRDVQGRHVNGHAM